MDRPSCGRAAAAAATSLVVAAALAGCLNSDDDPGSVDREEVLEQAVAELVAMPGGPPAAVVVVQRGSDRELYTAGVTELGTTDVPTIEDHVRAASVAKAFSGATALSLVGDGVLTLEDTIGERLPELPAAWGDVTLRQLLNHTSGLPDFAGSDAFMDAVRASLGEALPPDQLLTFVEDEPLVFPSGTEYAYSNSDNIAVALMIEAVTGRSYADVLTEEVLAPLELDGTSLPVGTEMPDPYLHGYQLEDDGQPVDVSTLFAAGWAWASGGVVTTPADLNDFIRGYVSGELFGDEVREAQQDLFIPAGGSEPTGPGENSASMGLFRYQTPCGTVYGHTGNTFGYTQFAAASPDGQRSVTVSITLQRTQDDEGQAAKVFDALRRTEQAAVCAALD